MKISPKIGQCAKFLVPVATAVADALVIATGDNELSVSEALVMAMAVLTALGVYAVPNSKKPESSDSSE